MKLSFEKASDEDVFKDSLKYEDYTLILQRCMGNIERKMEELCIATENTKESQIKGELQLVSMNKTINFTSEKLKLFEKDRREKDEIIKKKTFEMSKKKKQTFEIAQRIDKLENLGDRQEQYSQPKYLLVHGIAGTSDQNTDNLVRKTNEKLDVDITENKVDRSHRIGRKKDGERPRPIIVKLTRYNTRKKFLQAKES